MPAFAIAIGLGLAMATSAFKEVPITDPVYSFVFNPPSGTDFSDDAVMDLSNWQYTSDNDQCSGATRACKITVTSGYKTGSSPANYALDPSVDIQATENVSGEAHVTSIADPDGTYSNEGL